MKTSLMLCLLAVLAFNNATAQRIIGSVKDKNNQPLEGASISLKGSTQGTSTDSAGNFSFEANVTGELFLVATYMGYKPKILPVAREVHFILVKDPATLDPVVISAGSFEASDKSKGAVMTAMDVISVPGNGGDVANAVRTLPGAQQIGEREGLFVRGGSGEETRQFVDGVLVNRPYYVTLPGLPQYNRISSPFLFEGIVFSSGGYSALYGQGLSGALVMESTGMHDKSSAVIGLSPMLAVAGMQKVAKDKRSSWGFYSRYMNNNAYTKVIPQEQDFAAGPAYLMNDLNVRVKTGKTGLLKVYANFGYNKTDFTKEDIDSTTLRKRFAAEDRNLYVNISHRSQLAKNWQLDLAAAYNHNTTDIRNNLLDASKAEVIIPDTPYANKNQHLKLGEDFFTGRFVLSHYFAGHHVLKAGAEYQFTHDRLMDDQFYASFAEFEWRLARNLALRTGLRLEYSREVYLAPRISMAYRLPNGASLNAAYGIFYQKPENRYLLDNNNLPQAKATHYILNYLQRANGRLFRAEVFYKQYDRLLKTLPTLNMNGTGAAKGFELFWRDKSSVKTLDYWVSYSYVATKRDHLEFPYQMEPSFTAPHTLSVVARRFIEPIRTSAGISYAFAAGRPYYDLTSYGKIRDQGTTRSYNVVNLSLAHMVTLFPKWKEKDFTVIAFGVNNVLGTKQVFGYEYSYNGMHKMPVTLPAARSFFLGIFMSLGIDRTEDFLNDNL
ncbi:TonB-dependent receptor plug domain-containing protein [Chitinophaga sp. SYP-B3965]|uniref:TonB-dependent receptor n=1 Tax=Chitinophaga sp. SYP-B3965 TaxID=2663120 RepID=UPI001299E469|nr:TonB-dependent receptor [Chitinophaga sp. SYP-B3965]MRG44576.1 TonB-dependent receptor plug domain-containing protein [Chitinophaga sp. SYP-B3965]